ncbi:hypothetical protein CYMTET_56409 [Cymbomonas tetramitiformis]|uniref:Enoyl reductase (ER) domain-containing protein n=1 Tax=Cymbomonas tetramitiformis TaxID=36881 RepID=A0AAE0BCQ9_9CHLO|nr:hypothetical protein CYMTET_56409 [Cymbomonas tetramitiformis]
MAWTGDTQAIGVTGIWGPSQPFEKLSITRYDPGEYDICFHVKFCGVCHSDIHTAKNDLGGAVFPVIPGHELAGVVAKVGSKVKKFQVGDHIGVGCFVDSCLDCAECSAGDEQYCSKGMTLTYNSAPTHGRCGPPNPDVRTYGGYTNKMVIHERFAIKLPNTYPLEKAGPLMCAAITLWDPLRHWKVGPGSRVGIAGIGGLGHMGVKLARALGAEVTAITSSPGKVESAKAMGADHVVVSSDPESVKAATKSLDLILNTISAGHDVMNYVPLLDTNGSIVQLGLVTQPHTVNQLPLIFGRKSIAGSVIAGIKSTQLCIDFCAKMNIEPEVVIKPVSEIDAIYNILDTKNDGAMRYVLDMSTI